MRLSVLTALMLCAALLAAGCGGSGDGSGSTAPEGGATEPGGAAESGGAPKKATSPNAPAGSKVLDCEGGGAATQLRATAVGCDTAREVMAAWDGSEACVLAAGASRDSCSLDGFRCQGTKTDAGVAVSCARPGGDVSFVRPSGAG